MEGKDENYLTVFNNLKSGFICQCKETILGIEFIKFNLREYLCPLTDLKKSLESFLITL